MHRVHPVAAKGFESNADAYERARPTYAQAATDWLAVRAGLAPGATVVDVGAGTGKLTRSLIATGARVIAVEPLEAMRAQLCSALPDVEVLDATAEELPLPDATADLVTVGQAFHWFDADRALPEIHRVLRLGGRLALVWNIRDLEYPLQRGIEDLIDPHVPHGFSRLRNKGGPPIPDSLLFGEPEHAAFPNPQLLTRAALRDRVASTSFVGGLDSAVRDELLDRAVALADGLEEPFEFPYRTEIYLFTRS